MGNHSGQRLSAREMVRAHAYPVLAALSTASLMAIALLMVPSAIRNHRYNRCIEAQIDLRRSAARRTGQVSAQATNPKRAVGMIPKSV